VRDALVTRRTARACAGLLLGSIAAFAGLLLGSIAALAGLLLGSIAALAVAAAPIAGAGRSGTPQSLRPTIRQWPIPFGAPRRREMAAYSLRHYGEDSYVLRDPKVIVEHFTETATAAEAYNTFAPDVPDSELHELPNTCAHFLVERDGTIDQLVALTLRCRHTVGLNWTAIGIENVGFSDREVLDDKPQMQASLALTRWLRCTYAITLTNAIGHNESLASPYHHERVPGLRGQTHSDFNHADMHIYRTRLARLRCPAGSFGRVVRATNQPDKGGT
jgi:N-acetylmuramoyl-L-alanine amidase